MTTDTTTPVGSRLRALRKEAGLTQVELAERCGVRQGHISAWETGQRRMMLESAAAVARALDVSLDELVGGEDV